MRYFSEIFTSDDREDELRAGNRIISRSTGRKAMVIEIKPYDGQPAAWLVWDDNKKPQPYFVYRFERQNETWMLIR